MDNNYTPIKDKNTGELLCLGDFVENEKGQCGTLHWDEYFNRYLIKSETDGNIYAHFYRKVEKLKPNKIDTTKVECRKNLNKKKW